MPFIMGQSKPKKSGRKKGSLNKSSLKISEKLDELGINLVDEIFKSIPEITAEARINVYLKLLEYVYPKNRSKEVTSKVENTIQINVTDLDL